MFIGGDWQVLRSIEAFVTLYSVNYHKDHVGQSVDLEKVWKFCLVLYFCGVFLLALFFVDLLYLCVYCRYVHVHMGACGGKKRTSHPLDLELQVIVNCQI